MSAEYVVPDEWVEVAKEKIADAIDWMPDMFPRSYLNVAARAALAAVLPLAIAAERKRCARVLDSKAVRAPTGSLTRRAYENAAAAIRGDAT